MRGAVLLGMALSWSFNLQAAENRALLAAKTQYVRQTEPARANYLEILDGEIARLAGAGDLSAVVRLREHRGEFLLGLKAADDFGEESPEQISSELTAAASKFTSVLAESRSELESAYAPAIKAALSTKAVDDASRMQNELEALGTGSYAPSAMEVERQKPYEVRRTVLEPLLTFALGDGTIPDELSVDFQAQMFRITGVCRTDIQLLDGKTCGHFGKVVLLAPPRSKRTQDRHGYLVVGTRESYGQYSFVVTSGNHMAHVMQLGDLELNRVYEWKVAVERHELLFEVTSNGEVVKSEKIPGNNRTVWGFCATVRHLDTKSLLLVAVD